MSKKNQPGCPCCGCYVYKSPAVWTTAEKDDSFEEISGTWATASGYLYSTDSNALVLHNTEKTVGGEHKYSLYVELQSGTPRDCRLIIDALDEDNYLYGEIKPDSGAGATTELIVGRRSGGTDTELANIVPEDYGIANVTHMCLKYDGTTLTFAVEDHTHTTLYLDGLPCAVAAAATTITNGDRVGFKQGTASLGSHPRIEKFYWEQNGEVQGNKCLSCDYPFGCEPNTTSFEQIKVVISGITGPDTCCTNMNSTHYIDNDYSGRKIIGNIACAGPANINATVWHNWAQFASMGASNPNWTQNRSPYPESTALPATWYHTGVLKMTNPTGTAVVVYEDTHTTKPDCGFADDTDLDHSSDDSNTSGCTFTSSKFTITGIDF